MANTNILLLIEEKRKELTSIAMSNGLSATSTIICSRQLDDLLNIYLKHQQQPIRRRETQTN
jgi:Spo0E like sporulation regulatory protein